MATKFNSSQLKSQLRQLEQKQKRAINDMNRAIDNYNREVKRVVNNYNAAVRKYNSNVSRNRQIINNELRKLNSTTIARTSYSISSRTLQQHYEDIGRVYYEGVSVSPEQN